MPAWPHPRMLWQVHERTANRRRSDEFDCVPDRRWDSAADRSGWSARAAGGTAVTATLTMSERRNDPLRPPRPRRTGTNPAQSEQTNRSTPPRPAQSTAGPADLNPSIRGLSRGLLLMPLSVMRWPTTPSLIVTSVGDYERRERWASMQLQRDVQRGLIHPALSRNDEAERQFSCVSRDQYGNSCRVRFFEDGPLDLAFAARESGGRLRASLRR